MKSLVIAVIGCLALVGCTLRPLDGSVVGDAANVDFEGFAPEANEQVIIEGFDHHSNTWVTVATATSAATVHHKWADHDWFEWKNEHVNTDNPGSLCFWGAWSTARNACFKTAGGDNARFRVRGGGLNFLSYQDGFVDCITNEVAGGRSQGQAAQICAAPNSPEIRLSIIN
jgi:hypothetical protein